MKTQDILVDQKTLGSKLLLVEVIENYEYLSGKRTDNLIGYRYVVALVDRALEKVSVKIPGKKQIDIPKGAGFVEVVFENLELGIYLSNGQVQLSAKATGVTLANSKPA